MLNANNSDIANSKEAEETESLPSTLKTGKVGRPRVYKKGKYTLVQAKFRKSTLNRLDDFQRWTGITSRTQALASVVQIAHIVISEVMKGSKLIVQESDGNKKEILLAGLPA